MKTLTSKVKLSVSLIALTLTSGVVFAQSGKADLGKREFDSNCASCHGTSGKGNGVFKEYLRSSPTDLTTLTKRNGGVFPVSRMYETIEGNNVPNHSTRDMPIWGSAYRTKAAESGSGTYGVAPNDPESYVRIRIYALIDYLNRLQER